MSGTSKAVTTLAPLSPNTLLFISKKASNILLEGGVRASRHRVKQLEVVVVVEEASVKAGIVRERTHGVTVAASRGSERGRNFWGWAWRKRPGYTLYMSEHGRILMQTYTRGQIGGSTGLYTNCKPPPLVPIWLLFAIGLKDLGEKMWKLQMLLSNLFPDVCLFFFPAFRNHNKVRKLS